MIMLNWSINNFFCQTYKNGKPLIGWTKANHENETH